MKHEARELALAGFVDELVRSTSHPVVRKARGTAARWVITGWMEPQRVGLFQTIQPVITHRAKAVLEQPSPRRVLGDSLG